MSLFNLLETMFEDYKANAALGETKPSKEKLEEMGESLENMFFFSLLWSFGATINIEGRIAFNDYLL
jgi:hypothetical protein